MKGICSQWKEAIASEGPARSDHRLSRAIVGEGIDRSRRGAIAGGGERSLVEGSDLRLGRWVAGVRSSAG